MKLILKTAVLTCSMLVFPSCAHHVLTVAEPDATGDPVKLKSTAFLAGKNRVVINGQEENMEISNASPCDTNLLAAVHVQQDLGQILTSIITFGTVSSVTLTYVCSNKPPITGYEN